MGWTDERVDLLKKLWADGLSCSQIAKQLGHTTRNAVIGKISRLGLSGRATPAKPQRTVYRTPAPARKPPPSPPRSVPSTNFAKPNASGSTPQFSREPQPADLALVNRAEVAPETACELLDLGAHMCRWPIGDPALASFRFCGRRREAEATHLYCAEHAAAAFQHASPKKKPAAAELARSLRRYI